MTEDEATKYSKATEKIQRIQSEVSKVIVGQKDMRRKIIAAILCDGNVLIESYPGLGKTKTVRTISEVLGLDFSRIQNTPDLMPSDITGTQIIKEQGDTKEFEFQKGPIFANMVLADEINRATPKTQAALLEAMQEKQVTAGNQTYELEKPFFIMATQNPIDQEGTYPLPEAQSDRFMMKIKVEYPDTAQEKDIVDRFTSQLNHKPGLEKVLSRNAVAKLQEFTRKVPIAEDIEEEAVRIVSETRDHEKLEFGGSPRASMDLVLAGKARAIIEGRDYVSQEDIKEMAKPVLRHRIGVSFQAEKEGLTEDEVIEQIAEA